MLFVDVPRIRRTAHVMLVKAGTSATLILSRGRPRSWEFAERRRGCNLRYAKQHAKIFPEPDLRQVASNAMVAQATI